MDRHGCILEKSVLGNITEFTGKHLCQGKHLKPATLFKKEAPFLQNTSGQMLNYSSTGVFVFILFVSKMIWFYDFFVQFSFIHFHCAGKTTDYLLVIKHNFTPTRLITWGIFWWWNKYFLCLQKLVDGSWTTSDYF